MVNLVTKHRKTLCEDVISNNLTNTLDVKYNLNKQKAVMNKLEAADKSLPFSVQYADREGKQITIHCQAGQ